MRRHIWLACVLVAACGGTEDGTAALDITVTPASATLRIGETARFLAQGLDAAGEVIPINATWSSSDTRIATIDAFGEATAVSAGTVTLTAQVGPETATATLTVSSPALIDLEVSPPNLTLEPGATGALQATARFDDGSTSDVTGEAAWTSADGNVATVAGGTVTAVGAGLTTVSARYQGINSNASTIIVRLPEETALIDIDITPPNALLDPGGTAQLQATARFSDGTSLDVTDLAEWASADEAVATVAAGTVTAVAGGVTTITARYQGLGSAAATIVVTSMEGLVAIEVEPAAVTAIYPGQQIQFTAIGHFADGLVADITGQVEWTSTDPVVATVSASGLATAAVTGVTGITATHGDVAGAGYLTAIFPITVKIDITPLTVLLLAGQTVQLTATATMSSLETVNMTEIASWTSSDSTIATVDKGLVTALRAGSVAITATELSSGVPSSSALVTVLDSNPVVAMDVTAVETHICPEAHDQLTATGVHLDGTSEDITSRVRWSSSDDAIATVSSAGVVTAGQAPGEFTVTAGLDEVEGTIELDVLNEDFATVSVYPDVASVVCEQTLAVRAYALTTCGNTRDVTVSAVWASSDETVATVDGRGVVTGGQSGQAAITATFSPAFFEPTATLDLTVGCDRLQSIAITPAQPAPLAAGATLQLAASGYFPDATIADVTGEVEWTTSDPSVATVSGGLVTAVAPGSVEIGAVFTPLDLAAEAVSLTVVQP